MEATDLVLERANVLFSHVGRHRTPEESLAEGHGSFMLGFEQDYEIAVRHAAPVGGVQALLEKSLDGPKLDHLLTMLGTIRDEPRMFDNLVEVVLCWIARYALHVVVAPSRAEKHTEPNGQE